jgi:signal peptidase I
VQHGDIIVLRCPLDPRLDYLKRVIGLPGDEVRIRGGFVSVNGKVLDEPYISEPDPRTELCVQVEPDHFFVMGDNRPHSSDSREFGQVPMDYVRGRVDLRLWPISRIGTVH